VLQVPAHPLVCARLVAGRGVCGYDQPPALGLLPGRHTALPAPSATTSCSGALSSSCPWRSPTGTSQGSGCQHYVARAKSSSPKEGTQDLADSIHNDWWVGLDTAPVLEINMTMAVAGSHPKAVNFVAQKMFQDQYSFSTNLVECRFHRSHWECHAKPRLGQDGWSIASLPRGRSVMWLVRTMENSTETEEPPRSLPVCVPWLSGHQPGPLSPAEGPGPAGGYELPGDRSVGRPNHCHEGLCEGLLWWLRRGTVWNNNNPRWMTRLDFKDVLLAMGELEVKDTCYLIEETLAFILQGDLCPTPESQVPVLQPSASLGGAPREPQWGCVVRAGGSSHPVQRPALLASSRATGDAWVPGKLKRKERIFSQDLGPGKERDRMRLPFKEGSQGSRSRATRRRWGGNGPPLFILPDAFLQICFPQMPWLRNEFMNCYKTLNWALHCWALRSEGPVLIAAGL
ncbi:hypothetical protein HPG69_009300, partial [Diceros bicornis minor]